jgi:hypothetical protein
MATTKKNGAAKSARVETETRACSVELTEAERVLRGAEMAEAEVAIEALKTKQSALARQVKRHALRRNALGHALEAGFEERELVCSWLPDYKQNAWLLTRPDTSEVIDSRPMSATDLNVELFPDVTPLPTPPRSPRKRGRPPTRAQEPDITPAA